MKSSAKALAARLPALGTGVWKPDEDARLMKAVATYSGKNWKAVAAEVGTRNHIQCLQRWSKALNPNLEKGECHLYQCLVAGRVCLTAPPYLFEGRWHPEEDQQLHKLAKEHGLNWKMVTRFWVTGGQCRDRTGKQIRDRWISMLDPSINKGPWTAAEDQLLLEQHSIMGNAWTKIALLLPGRTGNKAKARYRILDAMVRHITPSNAAASSPGSLKRTFAAITLDQGSVIPTQPLECQIIPRPQQPVNVASATFALQDAAKQALSHCQYLPPLSRLIGGLPFGLVAPVEVPTSALATSAPVLPILQLEALKGQFPTQMTRIPPPLPPPTSASAPPLGQFPKDGLALQGVRNLPVASAVLKLHVEAHGRTANLIVKGEGDVMAVLQKRWKGYLEQDESAVVDLLKGKLKPAVMCNRPDPLSILALCAVHDQLQQQ
jgi:myb proto-oncogene protein